MTNPGGPTGITPGNGAVDGSGSVPGLPGRTQAAITAILQSQMETSPPWMAAASTFFGTLLGGFNTVGDFIQDRADDFLTHLTDAITGGAPPPAFLDIKNWAILKPNFSQVPLGSALSKAISPNEDVTFARASLNGGAASSVASGSGPGFHTHNLNVTPEYQPAGFGSNFLEIGYIRAERDRTYTQVALITGSAITWAGISALYLGVWSVNPTTGALTLLNVGTAGTDRKSSLSATSSQYVFPLGMTIHAAQNDVLAVGALQVTSIFQSCSSLLCSTLTDISGTTVQYPRKQYCYAGPYTSLPSTIAESSLNYTASNKLPFYALG